MRLRKLLGAVIERIYPPRHILFYLQRLVLYPHLRRSIASILSRILPKRKCLEPDLEAVEKLESEGYCVIASSLNLEILSEMRRFLTTRRLRDRFGNGEESFLLQDAPHSCHVAVYDD